jgi:hypothetical protein
MPVCHWDIALEQADDVQAAAKWGWKCLVDLANVFCAHHCDPYCTKEGLPSDLLKGSEGPSEEATNSRREQWLGAQYALHQALMFLPGLAPADEECSACAIAKALGQFPRLVPFSPKYPVATQRCNGVDCYPEVLADPSERSLPCCIIETSLADSETMTETAVREGALLSLDLHALPPIPPSEFSEIRSHLEPGIKAVRCLRDMREGVSEAADAVMSARGQHHPEAAPEGGCHMNVALQQLLSAVEKHRLAFLFCAYPRRKNPLAGASETGVWETVRKKGFPGWAEMERDADEDGKFLFRHCAVLDAYADEAISLFGPGDGCRPRIQTKEKGWVDVEGGTLPYWSLEEMLCHELEDSSQAILDTCAEVSSADTERGLTPLLKQVMAIAHDKGQSRWYGSVGVRWGYLSGLDAAIDAIRKARVTQREASNGDEELAAAGQLGLEPIRQVASALTQLRLATVALLHVFGKTDAYPALQVKAYHEALTNAKSRVDRISQDLAYGQENPKKIKTDVRGCIRTLSLAVEHLLSDYNESLAAHSVSKEKTEPVWEALRAGMAIELVLTMTTLKPEEMRIPVEDRRVSGLILLLLLAQAYYKMLECVISMASWCTALDLELNHYYLWVTTSLKNLLKNHEDLKDFPATFEPLFPDLYPSTIRDLDWDDMVAPQAEEFLSTVQRYVHAKGVCELEEDSYAWTFVELYRPAVETAVERAIAYNKRMRQFTKKVLGGSSTGGDIQPAGSTGTASNDAPREHKTCAPVADDVTGGLRENGVGAPAIEDPPTEAESYCVAFTHAGRRYLNEAAYRELVNAAGVYEVFADELSHEAHKKHGNKTTRQTDIPASYFQMLRAVVDKRGYFDPVNDDPQPEQRWSAKQILQRARKTIDVSYEDRQGKKTWRLLKSHKPANRAVYCLEPDPDFPFALIFLPRA